MNKIKLSVFPEVTSSKTLDLIPILSYENGAYSNAKITSENLITSFAITQSFVESSSYALTASYALNSTSTSESLSSKTLKTTISASLHNLLPGNVVYKSSSFWSKSKADSIITSEVYGIVEESVDVDNFKLVYYGELSLPSHSFNVGDLLFLSPYNTGELISYSPSSSGQVSKPIAWVKDENTINVVNYRGILITTGSSVVLSSSYSLTASYALNGGSGGGSTVSSSWASSSISASYALTASYALNGGGSGGNTISSSWASSSISSSYSLNSKVAESSSISAFSLNANTSNTASYSVRSLSSISSSWSSSSISSSYSLTSSYFSASYVTVTQVTASIVSASTYIGNLIGTASYTTTSSVSTTSSFSITSSYVLSASYLSSNFISISQITASIVSASTHIGNLTGNVTGTSSYSSTSSVSITASYCLTSSYTTTTASYSISSSLSTSSSFSTSASYAKTASAFISTNAQINQLTASIVSASSNIIGNLTGTALTASFITGSGVIGVVNSSSYSSTSSFITGSNVIGTVSSASYVLTSSFSTSSSYALTASYAINGGGVVSTTSTWKKLVSPMFVPVTTSSPIYANSASQTTLIKSICLYNTTATSSNCQLYNVPNVGGTLGVATGSNRLFNLDIPSYTTVQIGFGPGMTLTSTGAGDANDAIFASTTTTASITMAMFGEKPTSNTHLRLKNVGFMSNVTSSIITNPTSSATDVRILIFHNTDSATQTVSFYDVPNSASLVSSASLSNQLASIVLPPNDTFIWDLSDDVIKLDGTNDTIQVNSTTTNKVVVCGYGAQA